MSLPGGLKTPLTDFADVVWIRCVRCNKLRRQIVDKDWTPPFGWMCASDPDINTCKRAMEKQPEAVSPLSSLTLAGVNSAGTPRGGDPETVAP